jgi:subtilase family serine protease
MPYRRLVALVASTAFALAGCGGGARSAAPIPASVTTATGPAGSTAFAYDRATVAAAHFVARAAFARATFDVALRMRDVAGLAAYASSVSDPHSGNYRRYLGPTELADRFAATPHDRDAVVAYFRSFGLTVAGWKQRVSVRVSGDQASLERAFRTQFGTYRNATQTFLAPMTPPSLPANVPALGSTDIVHGVIVRYTAHYAATGGGAGGGRLTGYSPQQLAAAFDFTGAYRDGYTGSGITVGIIGTGPIATQTAGRLGDLEAYKAFYGVKGASAISVISATPSEPVVNGASGFASPPPVTGPCTTGSSVSPTATCNPEDGETQIDTEQVGGLALDSPIEYYLSYNSNDGCGVQGTPCPAPTATNAGTPAQGLFEADEELQTAIDHNSSDILSLSYGGPELGNAGSPSPPYAFTPGTGTVGPTGLDPTLFAMLAAEGIAVFVSSGDAGAQGCARPAIPGAQDQQCVSYPATDPSVVSVGGVTVPSRPGAFRRARAARAGACRRTSRNPPSSTSRASLGRRAISPTSRSRRIPIPASGRSSTPIPRSAAWRARPRVRAERALPPRRWRRCGRSCSKPVKRRLRARLPAARSRIAWAIPIRCCTRFTASRTRIRRRSWMSRSEITHSGHIVGPRPSRATVRHPTPLRRRPPSERRPQRRFRRSIPGSAPASATMT